MDDVFSVFEEQPYTFLEVSLGEVAGDRIVSEVNAMGVFKLRNEQVLVNNQELRQSAATLHIHPTESFANGNMVGNGIQVDGIDYAIIGQTGGRNFDTGVLEHYRLTLENANYSDFDYGS